MCNQDKNDCLNVPSTQQQKVKDFLESTLDLDNEEAPSNIDTLRPNPENVLHVDSINEQKVLANLEAADELFT